MAETQEAMMRKLEDVSGMIKTQSLKLTTQSEATDAQSTQVAEQAAKLAALQGAREDTRTSEHRSSSPAPDVRQGSNSVSASRQNVPKFHREAPQYPMWRKKICCTYPCLIAEKPLRRGLTQPSSATNESCPASCDTCLGHSG